MQLHRHLSVYLEDWNGHSLHNWQLNDTRMRPSKDVVPSILMQTPYSNLRVRILQWQRCITTLAISTSDPTLPPALLGRCNVGWRLNLLHVSVLIIFRTSFGISGPTKRVTASMIQHSDQSSRNRNPQHILFDIDFLDSSQKNGVIDLYHFFRYLYSTLRRL